MKKFLSLSLALLMLLSLAACGSAGLSEEYDEAEVLARAKELVLLINTWTTKLSAASFGKI